MLRKGIFVSSAMDHTIGFIHNIIQLTGDMREEKFKLTLYVTLPFKSIERPLKWVSHLVLLSLPFEQ